MSKNIDVDTATNQQLDWLVAKCEGVNITFGEYGPSGQWEMYSTNWSQGGPIIERERIQLRPLTGSKGKFWESFSGLLGASSEGSTPLVAAMRCFVKSKLGNTVKVPEELV
jgi:hypothetical protein